MFKIVTAYTWKDKTVKIIEKELTRKKNAVKTGLLVSDNFLRIALMLNNKKRKNIRFAANIAASQYLTLKNRKIRIKEGKTHEMMGISYSIAFRQ